MTTPLLQYVARFDGGGEIFGFGGGGYKVSWSWCSLFVEYPSLFVATSGEKPALRFRPRAVVAGRGVVAVFLAKNMFTISNPQVGYIQ